MNKALYNDSISIINYVIDKASPVLTVKNALVDYVKPKGKIIMVAIGKAAYTMAKTLIEEIDIDKGLVITKYKHSKGELKNTKIIEAGHPILDENSILGANEAINMCSNLSGDDLVIFLVSGGGSALFEAPLVSLKELQDVNDKLLKCGASITEINSIRKRLSKVKGGRFAEIIKPAKCMNIILSDIINDPLDMIASGPTVIDESTCNDALKVANKYHLDFSVNVMNLLNKDTIKHLDNVKTYISGNNLVLRQAAKSKCEELGYEVKFYNEALVDDISIEEEFIVKEINKYKDKHNTALVFGGEITCNIKGDGLGGRNQELALRIARYIDKDNVCMFAVGSDGTDGPTDAAGAYVDIDTYNEELDNYLNNNDSYHFFDKYGGLIKTGPTGTNVCDLYCVLIK